MIEAIVEELPAADVAPVVHGRWLDKNGGFASCYYIADTKRLMEYTEEGTFCPHCGARMEYGGSNEN